MAGTWPCPPVRSVAKEVLFAGTGFVFDAAVDETIWDVDDPFRVPRIADVPRHGTRFDTGDPVLTVFGQGVSPDAAFRDLARERDIWRRRIGCP